MRNFYQVLINTGLANITTSYLWFSLTFWVYLETGNVGLTGVLNGLYIGLIALGSIFFGSIVDHHKKKSVMMFAAIATLLFFGAAGLVWTMWVTEGEIDSQDPALVTFAALILGGAVVEHMRNIALSTTVTLMVPEERRDKANGLVGAVHGVAFFITSVIAGVSVGFLGMEITLWIALGLTVLALLHLIPVAIPENLTRTTLEQKPTAASTTDTNTAANNTAGTEGAGQQTLASAGLDLRGSFAIIMLVPGLLALILFSSFNNLLGGVYNALLNPYGLELFNPQVWGVVLGVSSLGFIIGGAIVAKTGLGANPVRTLLLVNLAGAVLGVVFGLREWWWLFAGGMFLFMLTLPAAEAAEQTILQRVVPYRQQGRVFGLAMAVEMAANPLSTIVVAVIAQAYLIPWMAGPGANTWLGTLLGEGSTRGMALLFIISGLIMIVVVGLAFLSRPYKRLSAYYASTSQDLAGKATAESEEMEKEEEEEEEKEEGAASPSA